MRSDVFFLPVQNREDPSSVAKKIKYLCDKSGAVNGFKKDDFIAVKTHFGEKNNKTHIQPAFVKVIIDKLKQKGTKPFLVETSTLYRGKRSNAVDHLTLAHDHGFGFENMHAPLVMVDGLLGDAEISVNLDGKHFQKVNIAAEIAKVQGLVVISHCTGHMAAGYGGAIKNVGMGLASRRGKLKQHSVMSPRINSSACTACGLCIQWCPQDTISWRDEKAYINEENCIGCGECLTVCKYGAVMFDWGRESADMQEMMAEHTAGVIRTVKGRVFFFNFLINITRSCDCDSGETPLCRDVGIVAGEDIVAVEKACHDIFYKKNGSRFQDITWPRINPFLQIEHAQNLGLGTTEYNLMELNEVLI